MRKPRSDSKLKTLPDDVQERIADWCVQDSLESAVSRCASELGLQTNRSSLSEWLAWWNLRRTFSKAEAAAKAAEDLLRRDFPDATPEKIAAAGQLVFTMQAANAGDAKEFRELEYLRVAKETAATNARVADVKLKQKEAQIRQKDRDLALVERRVKLLESNAAKAKEQLETVKKRGGISAETLKLIEEAAKIL